MKSIHKLVKAIFGTHREEGKYMWQGKSSKRLIFPLSAEGERNQLKTWHRTKPYQIVVTEF